MRIIVAIIAAVAQANIQIGVLSDPHYNFYYNPNTSSNNCIGNSVTNKDDYAPIGRYGCDSGPALMDLMLTRFKDVFGEVDVLLVPGDHVAH